MSWEAFRWTAKSPSELYYVLGPHGVDDMVRQTIAAVWRGLPEEGRTFAGAVAAARAVLDRNVRVWKAIKKPEPAAFFADLQPHEADGYLRQAMVLTWMMMPRTGGREVPDALRIISAIFDRNLAAWEEDNDTFTGGKKKAKKARPAAKKKLAAKPKPASKTSGRKRTAVSGSGKRVTRKTLAARRK